MEILGIHWWGPGEDRPYFVTASHALKDCLSWYFASALLYCFKRLRFFDWERWVAFPVSRRASNTFGIRASNSRITSLNTRLRMDLILLFISSMRLPVFSFEFKSYLLIHYTIDFYGLSDLLLHIWDYNTFSFVPNAWISFLLPSFGISCCYR